MDTFGNKYTTKFSVSTKLGPVEFSLHTSAGPNLSVCVCFLTDIITDIELPEYNMKHLALESFHDTLRDQPLKQDYKHVQYT